MKDRVDIDLAAMKARLLAMREELRQLARTHEHDSDPVELDQTTQGRLSRMDAIQGQAMAKEVARRRELEIKRIEAALQRIEEDEFGNCISCGAEIDAKRLDFDPSVPTCIDCARSSEG